MDGVISGSYGLLLLMLFLLLYYHKILYFMQIEKENNGNGKRGYMEFNEMHMLFINLFNIFLQIGQLLLKCSIKIKIFYWINIFKWMFFFLCFEFFDQLIT